ncbi:histone deacetylase family protein [Leptospira alexanderi serovar Manhao 3 str. L 60]|uniref:Histone deacetylase family protein n=2 Tax=Leptospira alexanderi TaxID=100053 RepID=V6I0K6_9LEPT|nr:histone deacetylase family protein [Leptospira alexanderi serovar Manhao 3 str. L 60]
MKMKTGFIYSEDFLYHNANPKIPHYESSDRLLACINKLHQTNYFNSLFFPEMKKVPSEFFNEIHSSTHLQKIERSKGKRGYFDSDTPFTEKSWIAAYSAANSGITLANALLSGTIKNGFSLLRPPGHHAEHNRIMGFCMLNNVAITARYLQKNGFKKIFIIDWDVHHGNGTQEIFYQDPNVFYLSIHQFPFYPMTGLSSETGKNEGIGTTKNIPMQANSDNQAYIQKFKEVVIPTMEHFGPDVVLISAGFDAHKEDPLGGMNITTKGFEDLTKIVLESADKICEGKVLSFLEGGYNLTALSESVEAHVAVLNFFS